jgi:hypothetical protein
MLHYMFIIGKSVESCVSLDPAVYCLVGQVWPGFGRQRRDCRDQVFLNLELVLEDVMPPFFIFGWPFHNFLFHDGSTVCMIHRSIRIDLTNACLSRPFQGGPVYDRPFPKYAFPR